MNRLIVNGDEPIALGALTPVRREGAARVLFIHGRELGFGTTARNLENYCSGRADIDAVHWFPKMTRFERLASANARVPMRDWDMLALRSIWASGRAILRRLGRPDGLPLKHFDVVHVMTQQRAACVEKLGGKTACKFVVNVDALTACYDRAFGIDLASHAAVRRKETKLLAKADAVACASRWVAESARTDCGVAAEKVFLHMPCVRGRAMAEDLAVPERDQSRPFRIVFVGNDWERKGGPRLLRWHQEKWATRAELHICSGKAPVDAAAKNVVWHGRTEHAKLINEVLPSMDLFVMPTVGDTFLIAAQEAEAAGLPVVTSRLAGIPEVVRDGVSGILCDANDDATFVRAVESIMGDEGLRRRLAAGAAGHAQRNLNADLWHNHLITQLIRLADGKGVEWKPVGVEE